MLIARSKKWIKYTSMKWLMIYKPKVTEPPNSRSPKFMTKRRNILREQTPKSAIKLVVILWKNITKCSRGSLHL